MIELVTTLEPSPEQLDALALALVRELLQGGKSERAALVEQSRQSVLAWRAQIERERTAAAAALAELTIEGSATGDNVKAAP